MSNGLTPVGKILGFCRHSGAELSRNEASGGIGVFCHDCRSWVTKEKGYDKPWLSKDHEALKGIDLSALPVVGGRIWRKCEGPCGEFAHCELHHLAPRRFFGDDADAWPVAYLCRPCHDRWHDVMTPGLCTAYDPVAHAALLLDYLGLERGSLLTKYLTMLGRSRRAGDAA